MRFSSMSIRDTRPTRDCARGQRRTDGFGRHSASTAVGSKRRKSGGRNGTCSRPKRYCATGPTPAGPKARTEDLAADWEYRRIRRGVLTRETIVLHSYGGVTVALKRAIELQPLAENRSVGTTIDAYST